MNPFLIKRSKLLPKGFQIDPKWHKNPVIVDLWVHKQASTSKSMLPFESHQKALQIEWDKLRDQGAWDLNSVREMGELKDQYRKSGKVAHFGIVFSICHKKPEITQWLVSN